MKAAADDPLLAVLVEAAWTMCVEEQAASSPGWSMAKKWAFKNLRPAVQPSSRPAVPRRRRRRSFDRPVPVVGIERDSDSSDSAAHMMAMAAWTPPESSIDVVPHHGGTPSEMLADLAVFLDHLDDASERLVFADGPHAGRTLADVLRGTGVNERTVQSDVRWLSDRLKQDGE